MPFKPSRKYKRLVKDCLPTAAQDSHVNAKNLDRLTQYALTTPEKLHKIGRYLDRRLKKKVVRREPGPATAVLSVTTSLIGACQTDITLLSPAVRSMLVFLFAQQDPQWDIAACNTLCKFTEALDDAAASAQIRQFHTDVTACCSPNPQQFSMQRSQSQPAQTSSNSKPAAAQHLSMSLPRSESQESVQEAANSERLLQGLHAARCCLSKADADGRAFDDLILAVLPHVTNDHSPQSVRMQEAACQCIREVGKRISAGTSLSMLSSVFNAVFEFDKWTSETGADMLKLLSTSVQNDCAYLLCGALAEQIQIITSPSSAYKAQSIGRALRAVAGAVGRLRGGVGPSLHRLLSSTVAAAEKGKGEAVPLAACVYVTERVASRMKSDARAVDSISRILQSLRQRLQMNDGVCEVSVSCALSVLAPVAIQAGRVEGDIAIAPIWECLTLMTSGQHAVVTEASKLLAEYLNARVGLTSCSKVGSDVASACCEVLFTPPTTTSEASQLGMHERLSAFSRIIVAIGSVSDAPSLSVVLSWASHALCSDEHSLFHRLLSMSAMSVLAHVLDVPAANDLSLELLARADVPGLQDLIIIEPSGHVAVSSNCMISAPSMAQFWDTKCDVAWTSTADISEVFEGFPSLVDACSYPPVATDKRWWLCDMDIEAGISPRGGPLSPGLLVRPPSGSINPGGHGRRIAGEPKIADPQQEVSEETSSPPPTFEELLDPSGTRSRGLASIPQLALTTGTSTSDVSISGSKADGQRGVRRPSSGNFSSHELTQAAAAAAAAAAGLESWPLSAVPRCRSFPLVVNACNFQYGNSDLHSPVVAKEQDQSL